MTNSRSIPHNASPTSGLLLAAALSLTLLAVSFARLAGDMGSTAFNLNLARSALDVPIWRSQLGINLGLFIISVTGLHLAFGVACWALARLSELALPSVRCKRRDWILLWFLGATVWALVANATWFPKTSLGEPYARLAAASVLGTHPLELVTIFMAAAILVIAALALRNGRSRRPLLLGLGILGLAAIAAGLDLSRETRVPDPRRPHIIILGIDSLRPDAIEPSLTPNLNNFLDGAIEMTDAITPLARTFPSWAAILTGRAPHTTGAHMNLLPRDRVRTGTTLPAALRDRGYRSWYAIDETRFSNLDASYGFDRTVTPTMGGSDFLLVRIADTPLSNLVVNTRIGAFLFPHVHTNRAASTVYDPDGFVSRLGRELDFRQPAFVAVHFTLPHWPFTWATSKTNALDSTPIELYDESIRRADEQLGDLLANLERKGALENALVIVLSDHGEALGRPNEFMADAYPTQEKAQTEFQRWGHGTSVFSPQQYRVVLSFRAYGTAARLTGPSGARDIPASLVDLAPTLLDLMQVETQEEFDGMSLVPWLQADPADNYDLRDRIRFTESEYNPHGFDPRKFGTSELAAAAMVYRLDPSTDRLTVREELLGSIMSSRQYAALLGNRAMAAAVPGLREDGKHQFVFVPLLSSPETDQSGDRALLGAALRAEYSIEIADAP